MIDFNHLPKLQVTNEQSQRYGDAVKKTAQLLNRPYFQIHNIFTREKWSIEEIERAYQVATKHSDKLSPDVAWWVARKKRNGV